MNCFLAVIWNRSAKVMINEKPKKCKWNLKSSVRGGYSWETQEDEGAQKKE